MNLYKAVLNGKTVFVKASSESSARARLYHTYKKKYSSISISQIVFVKKFSLEDKAKKTNQLNLF